MAPKPVAGGQASGDVSTSVPHRHSDSQTEDRLPVLKRHMLDWLAQYDCSRRAKGNSEGCIPGVDTLISKIKKDKTGLVSHLFHACLVKLLHETGEFDVERTAYPADVAALATLPHETGEFDVERVEEKVLAESGKEAVVDIKLRDGEKTDESEVLFIETQYGKSEFDHKKDSLRKAGTGSASADMADNMRPMLGKLLGQLPRGKGFLINYATGTDRMIPPLTKSWPNTKCVITVRSNMQAYIYGRSDFQYMEDARRICCLLGWNPNNMLGKKGPDKAMAMFDTVSPSVTESAIRISSSAD